jgi:hypothetical protein
MISAGCFLALIFLTLRSRAVPVAIPAPVNGNIRVDDLNVLRTAMTVAGFVGAVLAGLYAYRKQKLAECDARRADGEQLSSRYSAAAEQLGHQSAAVRLAGAYAMARLADDWKSERQKCIDVLCAYVRLPYETDPAKKEFQSGDREVRRAIIRIIRDHMRPEAKIRWDGCNFVFERAVFDYGDLSRAVFKAGCHVSFHRAKFVGNSFDLSGAHMEPDSKMYFTKASFEGADVTFANLKVSGGQVTCDNAMWLSGTINLQGAEASDGGMMSLDQLRLQTTT